MGDYRSFFDLLDPTSKGTVIAITELSSRGLNLRIRSRSASGEWHREAFFGTAPAGSEKNLRALAHTMDAEERVLLRFFNPKSLPIEG
ncbi:hypothetical protein [Pseudomonas sp. MWU16-30323]|uniref:hypothetical protein n=1 Tax=Pseudomonas sp. MWU16-30323 TaxID=2878094 RepID=UPI001CFB49DF|nr:hypothetical protein [Pseudomonas sp. MWU16-30323]